VGHNAFAFLKLVYMLNYRTQKEEDNIYMYPVQTEKRQLKFIYYKTETDRITENINTDFQPHATCTTKFTDISKMMVYVVCRLG